MEAVARQAEADKCKAWLGEEREEGQATDATAEEEEEEEDGAGYGRQATTRRMRIHRYFSPWALRILEVGVAHIHSMLTYAHVCSLCSRMLTYADAVCAWRIGLMYADVWRRLLTSADVC